MNKWLPEKAVTYSLVLLEQLSDAATVLWVTLAEVLDSPLLDELCSILDVASDVSYQTSALLLRQNIAVEVTHLVLVCVSVCVCVCVRACV